MRNLPRSTYAADDSPIHARRMSHAYICSHVLVRDESRSSRAHDHRNRR